MDQAIDLQFIKQDEEPEIGHTGNDTRVLLANFIRHVLRFKPRFNFPRRVLSPSLVFGAYRSQSFH